MGSVLGAVGVGLVIFMLFWLDKGDSRVTRAMWVPYAWLLIASSRPISNWLTLSQPGGVSTAYVDGSPLDWNVLTVLLVLGLVSFNRSVKTILAANPLILVFFAYCLLSLLWSDYPFVVLKRWIRSVGDIVVILLIITEPRWEDALRWIFKRIGFVLVPLSILLIRFYPALGRAYSRGGVPEWTGVGTDKNALGMLCMIYGASLLWHGIATYKSRASKKRRRQLWATGIAFAMMLYLLAVVDSKDGTRMFYDGFHVDNLDRFCSGIPKTGAREFGSGGYAGRFFLCAVSWCRWRRFVSYRKRCEPHGPHRCVEDGASICNEPMVWGRL